ncbi:Ada metal-binding domain-containing protein [Mucilaginibacter lutimaris]|uniref:Ada metal-binding domain-containing protein n=1 Tax=Mucilaginibacter lutimaris TaxID=931629 RepID=A0ABW2ZCS6_9SPHI
MIQHIDLGDNDFSRRKALKLLINERQISIGGNRKLKIYGKLDCTSGKRMKPLNRVFFIDRQDAINEGYRPCGYCMRDEYLKWKALNL